MALRLPALPARLIHADADAFVQRCVAELTQAATVTRVELDGAALEVFDSSVLALLLAVRRAAKAQGAELHVLNLPPRLRDLSTLYGVSELLPA